MTRVFDDPARFMEDMLEGFCSLYSDVVTPVAGGVVRAQAGKAGKVAVVVGGGSGHYPAFCGIVGPGFADGAVVGNVFTSPSAQDAINVAAAADNGAGVILTAGNYAGDVLHFNEAAATLRENGIDARTIYVTDDVASAPKGEEPKRRGIAGDFVVFKAMSAAAEAGYSIDEVLRVGNRANDATRTMGVAFAGCTLPGQSEPLFTVPKGKMGVGLGIHGEPGISEKLIPTANELATELVGRVVKELPLTQGSRVGVILNGLGSTKYEELFLLWRHVQGLLQDQGLEIIDPEVGELVTSLDMAGLSLTLVHLDEELEQFWVAPAKTPAFTKGLVTKLEGSAPRIIRHIEQADASVIKSASAAAKNQAKKFIEMLRTMELVLVESEDELGRIDAVAGDGDHGRGMVKGVRAALAAAETVAAAGAGIEQTLHSAGEAWAAKAGGTSGALWGAALRSVGEAVGDRSEGIPDKAISEAMQAGYDALQTLGKASLGDKTMLDSLAPFVSTLNTRIAEGTSLGEAWAEAAKDATKAAKNTSGLVPKIGRARPLAERSVGTPDAGATSLAMILEALAKFFQYPEEGVTP